jgi:putative peptidoglycan lipid II flippase
MFFKVLLASFIMVIFILNFSNEVNFYLEVDAWQRITSIAMTIGAAAVIYFVCLRLLGIRMEHL